MENRTGPVGVESAEPIPRPRAVGRAAGFVTISLALTTVSSVSGSSSWMAPLPRSSGSESAVRWIIGTRSSRAFRRPCMALVSPGPGTVMMAAGGPPAS